MRVALIMLIALAGYATATISPTDVRVVELDHGVYEKVDGKLNLVEVTEAIPCRVGATFGVRSELRLADGSTGKLRVTVMLSMPESRDGPSRRSETETLSFDISDLMTSIQLELMKTMKRASDLIDGLHEIQLIQPQSGAIHHSHTFALANRRARVARRGSTTTSPTSG